MSTLKGDIYKAFEKSMGGSLKSPQSENVDELSKDLAKAFIDFITNQEFRVLKMESNLNLDSVVVGAPVVGTPNGGGPVVIPTATVIKGLTTIGTGKVSTPNTNLTTASPSTPAGKSMVKLLKDEVKKGLTE